MEESTRYSLYKTQDKTCNRKADVGVWRFRTLPHRVIRLATLLALLQGITFSTVLYAVPSWFNGPVQDGLPPLRTMLMPWNIFERQQFTHAGGSVGFNPWVWDE